MSFIILGNATLPYFQINDITSDVINSYSKNIFTILIYNQTFKVVNYANYETVLSFEFTDIVSPALSSAALLYQYLIDNQYFILVNIIIEQPAILETINVNLTGETFNVNVLTIPTVEIKNDTGNPISISASSLPLPTLAATSTLQTTCNASLASIDAGIPVALGQTTMSASMPVVISSNQTAIPISASSLPLPTLAATSTLQTTANASLASIDAGIPVALGQTTMANSMAVVIASNQTAIPTSTSTSDRTYGSKHMGLTPISMPSAATNYLAVGVRLKVANIANIANIISLSATVYTNDQFLWTITQDPTFSSPPTWVSFGASSYIETTVTTGITLTAGTVISSGYSYQTSATSITTDFICLADIQLKDNAGTPINYILSIAPLTSNATTLASINWFQI